MPGGPGAPCTPAGPADPRAPGGPCKRPLISAAVSDLFLTSAPVTELFLICAPVINVVTLSTAAVEEPASATNRAAAARTVLGEMRFTSWLTVRPPFSECADSHLNVPRRVAK